MAMEYASSISDEVLMVPDNVPMKYDWHRLHKFILCCVAAKIEDDHLYRLAYRLEVQIPAFVGLDTPPEKKKQQIMYDYIQRMGLNSAGHLYEKLRELRMFEAADELENLVSWSDLHPGSTMPLVEDGRGANNDVNLVHQYGISSIDDEIFSNDTNNNIDIVRIADNNDDMYIDDDDVVDGSNLNNDINNVNNDSINNNENFIEIADLPRRIMQNLSDILDPGWFRELFDL